MLNKYKYFIIPAVIGFLISSFYIIKAPGGIQSDAKEYDDLANSILIGQYSIDGSPSMMREPGYPMFRAGIKIFNQNPKIILWIQDILYFFIILFVGLALYKVESRLGSLGAWGAGLSYGLAFYPSVHLSETFTAFLLASIGLVFINTLEKPILKYFALLGILSGFLVLTRYTYILIPLVLFLILLFKYKSKKSFVGILILLCIVSPWVIRNYINFKEINVAGRSGGILYARAWKADKSWRALGDSYLSVFLGRGILFDIYPSNQSIWLDQWGDWWRNPIEIKKWGDNASTIDQNRKKAAFTIIFSNFNTFSKFIVWSGVDELRLLELPNPILQSLGSPFEGTYGPLAKENKLDFIQLAGLIVVHLTQMLWFVLIAVSTYIGFKKYKYKYISGIFLICIFLPHAIADNIPRYGAPLQPWLLSAIFMTILLPIYIKFKNERNIHNDNNSRI